MANRKKAFRIVGLAATILVLAGVALYTVSSIDDAAPNVDDLRVQRLDIPPAENGYVILGQAVAKLDFKFDEPTKLERFERMGRGLEWDAALAQEVLARNAEALALWEKAMAAPHFQGSEVRSMEDSLNEGTCAAGYRSYQIAWSVCIRARARGKQGDWPAAFDDLVSVVRFGHRIEQSKGSVIAWTVGVCTKGSGLEFMREIMPEAALTAPQFRAYGRQIAAFPADANAYADAIRNEYTIHAGSIDYVASGTSFDSATEQERGVLSRWFWYVKLKPVLKPNRTKALLADIARGRSENGSKCYNTSIEYVFDQEEAGLGAGRGNSVGVILARSLVGIGNGMPDSKCQENVSLAATRALLALKAYKMEKGRLPERLDQLVPEYLDALPMDDFDGKPLRYNVAKKIIYSVGKDLKDDGGMTKKEYVEAKMKERGLDPKTADPKDVEDIEGDFLWKAPNPAFPIDF
jgi:hypothetical protein